jgi:hypothetical protein
MPQTYQKKIRHLATKKNTSKGPAKKYKSKPQNTQTMQKKYQNTPNKTLKYHTQKKNIRKPLASSLCPGAPRASSPRPDRKHRSAAAAWDGGRSLKNPLAPKVQFLRAHVDRKQLRNCNSY